MMFVNTSFFGSAEGAEPRLKCNENNVTLPDYDKLSGTCSSSVFARELRNYPILKKKKNENGTKDGGKPGM